MNTEILIYGDIGESFWDDNGITDKSVTDALQKLDRAASHTVRINSLGGQTNHGVAIYNILEAHKTKQKALNPSFTLNTIVDGFAYSAASIIMLAGDKRIMNLGSRAMIHNPWSVAMGDHREFEKMADYLKKAKDSSVEMYAIITGKDKATIDKLMDDETYLSSEEAVDLGLATETLSSGSKERSQHNPYESNKQLFTELSKLGKGAYVKTMMLGRNNLEKNKKYPIDRLQKELNLDRLLLGFK